MKFHVSPLSMFRFSAFEAKKAKFGFRCRIELESLLTMAAVREWFLKHDPDALHEFDTNMGHNQYRIYTNDQLVAEKFVATSWCRD